MGGAVLLETERLILRPFRKADLALYAGINADPAVVAYLGGVPLSRITSDGQAIGANHCFADRRFGKIAVERRNDGALLGMCGLSVEPWFPADLEIGWRLGRAYWGFGYAAEAASAWLDYAFDRLGVPRVISVADAAHTKSIATMRRIGMTLDHAPRLGDGNGEFDAVVYSISPAAHRHRRGKLS